MRSEPRRGRPADNRTPSESIAADDTLMVRRPSDDGVQLTQTNSSSWWAPATSAVQQLARLGRPFSTEHLRALGVPEPELSSRWGSLMAASSRTGIIESAGAVIGCDGRPRRCWVGVATR